MVTVEDIVDANIETLSDPKKSKADTISLMKTWDGYQFEKFWAELKRRDGYAARATRERGDRGIDVVSALRVDSGTRRITLSQTKCYKDSIRPSHVEKYDYLTNYGHEVEFVTTATYSDKTAKTAEAIGITLVGPDDIYDLIRATNAWDLLVEDPISTAPSLRPRSVDVLVGVAFGAAGIKYRETKLVPLDSSTTPVEAYIEAIRALFIHGFIQPETLSQSRENKAVSSLFVYADTDEPHEVDISELVELTDDWYLRIPSDDPEELMTNLARIIKFVANMQDISEEDSKLVNTLLQ